MFGKKRMWFSQSSSVAKEEKETALGEFYGGIEEYLDKISEEEEPELDMQEKSKGVLKEIATISKMAVCINAAGISDPEILSPLFKRYPEMGIVTWSIDDGKIWTPKELSKIKKALGTFKTNLSFGSNWIEVDINLYEENFKNDAKDYYLQTFRPTLHHLRDNPNELYDVIICKYADSFFNIGLIFEKSKEVNDYILPELSGKCVEVMKIFAQEIDEAKQRLEELREIERRKINESMLDELDREIAHVKEMVVQRHDWKIDYSEN